MASEHRAGTSRTHMSKTIKPPFDEETARAKVKAAQDAWNTRNPQLVAQSYTED